MSESGKVRLTGFAPGCCRWSKKDNVWIAFKQMDLSGMGAVTFIANVPFNYGMMGGTVEVNLSLSEGELIGTSSPIAPTEMKMDAPPSEIKPTIAVAPLKPTQGKQDVYFVCKGVGVEAGPCCSYWCRSG